ncbi:VCBS repeat-containing protein [Spirosoma horti]
MKAVLLVLILLACLSCRDDKPRFVVTNPAETGVAFTNQLTETEEENVLAFEYFYNGAGVAAGDLNNDGKVDLYYTGNQVANKLFINKGGFAFDDITTKAGVAGRTGGWKTGVTLADVNADGWLDIYVCYGGLRPDSLRKNQLFINNHNLTFTDRAAEYGLADSGYSVQANFFDYDLDGDLDCFLINHNLKNYQRKEASVMRAERDYNAGDKLLRNDGKVGAASIHFTDVSEQAGIKGNPLGFGLGVSVSDINRDGYPDVYVTNDFVEDDYCYINQGNGTFRDELRSRIDHTSYSAMGADIADLNNDARPDIMTLDMLPESNARQKLLPWPDNWNVYQAQLKNGFWHQNMRNMLQIQQPDGEFAEIGQLAGVAGTDWSWGVVLADFDLDGYKDIFVSNGTLRDFTNADFIKFSDDNAARQAGGSVLDQIRQMPSTRTKNYIFRNNHDLTFTNEQAAWGFDDPTISNGCAYADLDGDGDLEIITNNLNEPARIYRNNTQETAPANYLSVQLKGPSGNPFGIGVIVTVGADKAQQVQEYFPTRGFESCSHGNLLFGTGTDVKTIPVTVRWPDGKTQVLPAVTPNQTLTLDYRQANAATLAPATRTGDQIFSAVNAIDFTHKLDSTNNFDQQILLPIQYSATGVRMATGDVNNDGLMDLFVGGNKLQPGQLFYQQVNGSFMPVALPDQMKRITTDAVLLDVNGDKQLDLYVVNGGYSVREANQRQDQLWLNDKGTFISKALPTETENGSCVKVIDIDRDGDSDLFVGGAVRPFKFPASDESFLLINDGQGNFKKQPLGQIGIVSDAAVLDINNDSWPDLVIVGEWMPVTVLLNQRGKLSTTNQKVYENLAGWWNRIEKADLDGDGDDDLILGNLGLNTQIKASEAQPATLTYDDFDQNGTLDFFMSYAIQGKVYPAYSRDEICEQVPSLRKRFTTYQAYADATLNECFDEQQLRQAKVRKINELQTLMLENNAGDLVVHSLPTVAQYAPVYSILVDDVDRDGKPDLLLMGNNSRMRLRIGKVDANHGLLLHNQGKWQFSERSAQETGLMVRGDVRDVKKVNDYIVVGVNGEKILTFKQKP